MEKDGACKMDKQNKTCSSARKSGRRKNNAGKNIHTIQNPENPTGINTENMERNYRFRKQ